MNCRTNYQIYWSPLRLLSQWENQSFEVYSTAHSAVLCENETITQFDFVCPLYVLVCIGNVRRGIDMAIRKYLQCNATIQFAVVQKQIRTTEEWCRCSDDSKSILFLWLFQFQLQFKTTARFYWNKLSSGEKVFVPICALNLLAFGLWRVQRLQPFMLRYFCSNPVASKCTIFIANEVSACGLQYWIIRLDLLFFPLAGIWT